MRRGYGVTSVSSEIKQSWEYSYFIIICFNFRERVYVRAGEKGREGEGEGRLLSRLHRIMTRAQIRSQVHNPLSHSGTLEVLILTAFLQQQINLRTIIERSFLIVHHLLGKIRMILFYLFHSIKVLALLLMLALKLSMITNKLYL